jgi:hypothetical protein
MGRWWLRWPHVGGLSSRMQIACRALAISRTMAPLTGLLSATSNLVDCSPLSKRAGLWTRSRHPRTPDLPDGPRWWRQRRRPCTDGPLPGRPDRERPPCDDSLARAVDAPFRRRAVRETQNRRTRDEQACILGRWPLPMNAPTAPAELWVQLLVGGMCADTLAHRYCWRSG